MSFLRPEALSFLSRWAEAGVALATVGLGLWLMRLGGYFLSPLGASVILLAVGWLMIALRRLRFARPGAAPGVVEVDEGQIGFLGPTFGGYVALRELVEIRMIRLNGAAHWRLRQADGQVLLVPHAATGVEALYDALAALPAIDMARVSSAGSRMDGEILVWERPQHVPLT